MTRPGPQADLLPELLSRLHRLDFDHADGDGIEFEPFDAFLPEDESIRWFKVWTGNPEADGRTLRVFGQDGTGGHAAFWLHRQDRPLLDQPIVFLGSEGAIGVVAKDFDDYLWLLASGHGPLEAVEYPDDGRPANAGFSTFAEGHAKSPQRPASVLLAEANAACPDFVEWVTAQCR